MLPLVRSLEGMRGARRGHGLSAHVALGHMRAYGGRTAGRADKTRSQDVVFTCSIAHEETIC